MVASTMPEAGWFDINNRQRRPGRNENRDEKKTGNDDGLNLGDAEAAIVVFLPVIMMVKRKYGAKVEAEEKCAQG